MTGPSTQTGTGNLPNTNFPILTKNFSLIQGRKTRITVTMFSRWPEYFRRYSKSLWARCYDPGGSDMFLTPRSAARPTQSAVKLILGFCLVQSGWSMASEHPTSSSAWLWMGRSWIAASPQCLHRRAIGRPLIFSRWWLVELSSSEIWCRAIWLGRVALLAASSPQMLEHIEKIHRRKSTGNAHLIACHEDAKGGVEV
jgi:hypothetical protein